MSGFFIFVEMLRYGFIILVIFSLGKIHSQENESISLLQELIRFQSFSYKEKALCDYLKNYCQSKQLFVESYDHSDTTPNFIASLYPLDLNKPNIIFTSHLDVVPVDDTSNWSVSPYAAILRNDTLFGRGSIDCLGLAVMQLESILKFKASHQVDELPFNVSFLAVSGEEMNSIYGAKYVLDHFKSRINPLLVFGEGGSGMNELVPSKPELQVFGISTAEKSSLWLRLEVKNKTHGHGSVPPDLYANKRLLKSLIDLLDQRKEIKFSKLSRKMFKDLGRLEGGFKGFVIKHINWDIFWPFVKKYFREGEIFSVLVSNTFVITEIGTINHKASNQIATGAYAVLDCRLLPGTDIKKFIRRVQFAVGMKVDISIISQSPNSMPSETTEAFEQIQQALEKVYPGSFSTPILFPASTDNNYFRLAGIPTYGIIPCVFSRPALEGIHGSNEFITLDNLKKGTQVYLEFLKMQH